MQTQAGKGAPGKGDEKDLTREEREDAAAAYGWSLTMINSSPELKKIFNAAIDKGYSPARFVAELRDTKWFKTHSESWRANEVLRRTDPGSWKQKRAQNRAALRDNAARMGAALSDKQLDRMVDNVMMFGWNESQQADALAGYVKTVASGPMKGQYLGDAGRSASELRKTARANGYSINGKQLGEWNRAIARGDRTIEDYGDFMRRQAALQFPTFANELLAGADMDDLASPYKNAMARLWEVPESDIDLFNPAIRKALASKNEKTGKPEAMAVYDFEDSLRKDPRWLKTDQARSQVMGTASYLLKSFGFTA